MSALIIVLPVHYQHNNAKTQPQGTEYEFVPPQLFSAPPPPPALAAPPAPAGPLVLPPGGGDGGSGGGGGGAKGPSPCGFSIR